MKFIDLPPREIGEVVFSWTNNGPDGPAPAPLGLRLLTLGLCAGAGFVIGLIGFFVVGGVLEHQGRHIEAAWFLYSLAGGVALGALVGVLLLLRPAKVATLYVGRLGCADISAGKVRLLQFRDIEGMRQNINVMTYQGIRSEAREIYVKQNGRERLYLVSSVGKSDPQAEYCDAVLAQYAQRA
jgi:hypothetical protein